MQRNHRQYLKKTVRKAGLTKEQYIAIAVLKKIYKEDLLDRTHFRGRHRLRDF